MRARTRPSALPFLFVLASAGCASLDADRAPLFEGTGDHGRGVTTDDDLAQRYFDQGLALSYGFNHDEAVRSFRTAAEFDPGCAMAWWGQAYALGPNINLPVDAARSLEARAAIERALAECDDESEVERALIAAQAERFAPTPPEDRRALDEAYAEASGAVWERFPDDADVGFLYADALMNLAPWDLWTADFEPTEYTPEILDTLESVLALDLAHPGANHFYVHALEASADPARAEAAADRLGGLAPGLGHMVHMPSHIYVQVGRFEDSIRVNEAGSALDRDYFERVGGQTTYHFYHAHNNHFRVWTALYMGDYDDALEAVRTTLDDLPDPFEADPGAAEWLAMDVHVHLRFGNWEAVLELPSPREDQPYAVAMWRYGRGVAFANTGRFDAARAELDAFEAEVARVPEGQTVFIVDAHAVLDVARHMLLGELHYKQGDVERGLAELRLAVEAEDALRYSEPSPWMVPTRHALGALLLEQGAVSQALEVYERDLRSHPGNVWALHGRAECLERVGDAAATRARGEFAAASALATVEVRASCFCRTEDAPGG